MIEEQEGHCIAGTRTRRRKDRNQVRNGEGLTRVGPQDPCRALNVKCDIFTDE